MSHKTFHLPLTSGGGLAGVDVSDDDDVDMSLFLTVEMEDMSAMIIAIKLGFRSKRNTKRRQIVDDCLPHGGGLD